MKVHILGSSSAFTAFGRHPSSQYLEINNTHVLIDCGEGTQDRIRNNKLSMAKLEAIFISHLHGDHFLGLFGLLSSMNLLGRKRPLKLFGPVGLMELLTTYQKYSGSPYNFHLDLTEIPYGTTEVIFENNKIEVSTFPLYHRVDCQGYRFEEKPKLRHLISDKLPKEGMLPEHYKALGKGEDLYDSDGGLWVKNEEVTRPPSKSFSYAYCSDTRYNESIIPHIKGVDLLYHEATFKTESADRAEFTGHSTTTQAGMIAQKAQAGKLIIGHFSSRYQYLEELLEETKAIFPQTVLAEEGTSIDTKAV